MAKQPPRRPQQPAPKNQPSAAPSTPANARKTAPVAPRKIAESRSFSAGSREMIFGRQNFLYMGIGLGLVLLGLGLMTGGAQPDPNNWDPNIPYSFRRITLAPLLMVAGFVVVAYGIFIKNKPSEVARTSDEITA
jgi:Protein of unknown function (DUF3098)